MPEHPGFLADILEHPEDDTPRLIYADWLQDNGQPERAEFICVQIELYHLLSIEHDCDGLEGETTCPACGAASCAQELSTREAALIREHAWRWLREDLPEPISYDYDRWKNIGSTLHIAEDDRHWVRYQRGFLTRIWLPLGLWNAFGPELVTRCPLEDVTVVDAFSGYQSGDRLFLYLPDGREKRFYDLLLNAPSHVMARIHSTGHISFSDKRFREAAVSWALLTWARQAAASQADWSSLPRSTAAPAVDWDEIK